MKEYLYAEFMYPNEGTDYDKEKAREAGRSAWCELNYTNLAVLGEFRIYIDKDDTIVMVNLDSGLFALNVGESLQCKTIRIQNQD